MFGSRLDAFSLLLVYCADCHCSHSITLSADHWLDDMRLSDVEGRFIGSACGRLGADIRPNFTWDELATSAFGYR